MVKCKSKLCDLERGHKGKCYRASNSVIPASNTASNRSSHASNTGTARRSVASAGGPASEHVLEAPGSVRQSLARAEPALDVPDNLRPASNSKQRWPRESYNAYQREYMRKARAKG